MPKDLEAMTLRVEELSKRFGRYAALDGVSLDIPKGELVALLQAHLEKSK